MSTKLKESVPSLSGTLHPARITPRILAARQKRAHLSFPKFERALKFVYRYAPYRLKAIPKVFWITQLDLWNKGYRGAYLHDDTIKAAQYAAKFPMGH